MSNLKLEIIADSDVESPRSWCNLGTMVCQHSRYNLGDDNGMAAAIEVIRSHYAESFLDGFDLSNPRTVLELLEKSDQAIILPLYLYDHSGITMSTTPFSCPWDSGQVGYIFVAKKKARAEYGWSRLTRARVVKVEKCLIGEVQVYDQYLQGDVWGYQALQDDEVVDSCWGFYGSDPNANGIAEHVPEKFLPLLRAEQYERRYSL